MHIAIIMDGNGRWATQRGLPRSSGHREGAKAVRKVVEAAAQAGIETLSLYAFSSDNWARPAAEVAALMRLFRRFLIGETQTCLQHSIRLSIIGRRDRLAAPLLQTIEHSERQTAACSGMQLRIAIDYSARFSIMQTVRRIDACTALQSEAFLGMLDEVTHCSRPSSAVDLLIRTGGEKRLSDFLLWECAYAELYFTDCMWPEFDAQQFSTALADFERRQRRFGHLLPNDKLAALQSNAGSDHYAAGALRSNE